MHLTHFHHLAGRGPLVKTGLTYRYISPVAADNEPAL